MRLACGWLAFSVFSISAAIALATADAQKPKVPAPHDPIAPRVANSRLPAPVPGTTAAGPWIVDSHFQSTIYLKNIVETSAITVVPVLHFSDGSVHKLAAVQLEASGTARVDVGAGLAALGIAPNATLSGWVEIQYNWAWDPICAMLRVLDTTRSVVFAFGFGTPESLNPVAAHTAATQVTEGMWWKQEPKVAGFVSLANTTSRPITATVTVSDHLASPLGTHSVTVKPGGMETLDLLEIETAAAPEGGIQVSYKGEQDALIVGGGLEDVGVGYSANIPFAAPAHAAPPMAKATVPQGIAELGIMTGAADPWMHFPSGTVFTPYSALRNVSNAPIAVSPTLWWMQGNAPASFDLPQFTLAPFETRNLDVLSLLGSAGLKDFSGSVNLVFDTQGQTGLLLASGSVDQTFNYVFPVAPRGIAPSASKSLSYWSTGNGDDTMVTMWNPADEQQSFLFRIFFSGGHYDRLITLGARATYMFDITEIMAGAGPDLEGNVIPPGAQEGSVEIVGEEADNQSILLAVDSSIYNVRKATCAPNCINCDGATSWSVTANPWNVNTGQLISELMKGQYCSGQLYNWTGNSTWTSSNTSVATVQTGQISGVSPGSATVTAYSPTAPICAPQCNGSDMCPAYTGGGGSAPGAVYSATITNADINANSFSFYLGGPTSASGAVSLTVQTSPNGTSYTEKYSGGANVTPSTCNQSAPCTFGLTRANMRWSR